MARTDPSTPSSKYDASHISADLRADLGKMNARHAAEIRRVADEPRGRPRSWEENLRLAKSTVGRTPVPD